MILARSGGVRTGLDGECVADLPLCVAGWTPFLSKKGLITERSVAFRARAEIGTFVVNCLSNWFVRIRGLESLIFRIALRGLVLEQTHM